MKLKKLEEELQLLKPSFDYYTKIITSTKKYETLHNAAQKIKDNIDWRKD